MPLKHPETHNSIRKRASLTKKMQRKVLTKFHSCLEALKILLRLGVWLKWEMTGTKNFLFLFYMIPLISELFQAI